MKLEPDEVIEVLKDFSKQVTVKSDGAYQTDKGMFACRAAIKALEKQIPKKPIFNHNHSDTLSIFHCECGNFIKVKHDIGTINNNNAPNYCSNCGQKLKWRVKE